VLVQPYPDGVSSRRTSAMAGLALGVPVVTNAGPMTEPVWAEHRAVSIVDRADGWVPAVLQLLGDAGVRARQAEQARALYADRFDLSRTIDALRHAS
jgi:glycosyltransferase involved in cell wall biosynthesis